MVAEIVMPKMGLTMTVGSVGKWLKKEGDPVSKGDHVAEVLTEKITNLVDSPADGVLLRISAPEGTTLPIGGVMGYVGAPGEALPGLPPEPSVASVPKEAIAAAQAPQEDPGGFPEERPSRVRISPVARKMAQEHSIDYTRLQGTGPDGRITKEDIEAVLASPAAAPESRKVKASPTAAKAAADLGVDVSSIAADGRVMKVDVLKAASPAAARDVRLPLSPMRKVIAERMSLSRATIPSVAYDMDVDFTALGEFRSKVKAEGAKRGVKISYNHILMKICAAAVKDVPLANSSFDGDAILLHGNVNIGLAVAVDGGLLVPNVKAVQEKSLLEIAEETERLVDQARSGKLALEDMQGGTFTITNLGMFGTRSFTPIVNPPEACILGVNAITEKPVAVDGTVVIRPMSVLSLVADHRILDGAEAARFLARVRELAENPWLLLL